MSTAYYSYTYHLKQDLEKVYEYFRQKEYLSRVFRFGSEELVINSEEEEGYIQEGEKFEMIIGDREAIVSFEIEALEVREEVLIDLSVRYVDIVDKSDTSVEEDFETLLFMKKHLGMDVFFKLEFFDDFDMTRVRESAELQNPNLPWYIRTLWKLMGWYFIFKNRRIHQEIKFEVEEG